MRFLSITAALVVSTLLSSCIPKPPTRTERPQIDVAPWQELTVRSDRSGHTYRYLFAAGPSEGAPAMLLLHGGFFDQRMWLYTNRLSERFNVYALEWPNTSLYYSGHIEDYGEIAADFLDALSVIRAYVAGVSMGAFAAIDLVSRKTEIDFPAVFLFSAVMFGITEEEIEKRTAMAKRALAFAPDRLRRIAEWRVSKSNFNDAPGEIQQDDIFYTRPYPYYYQVFSMTVNQGAKRQDTMSIDCPVLILHGTADATMPIDVARLSASVFKDAEFREYEGYTHSMIFSHGSEFVDTIFDFLSRRDL